MKAKGLNDTGNKSIVEFLTKTRLRRFITAMLIGVFAETIMIFTHYDLLFLVTMLVLWGAAAILNRGRPTAHPNFNVYAFLFGIVVTEALAVALYFLKLV